jgi:4-azaleucine resistance transporter AzlC
MKDRITALKAAFPHTIPVMTGYLFLGAAFGILMDSKGYHFVWSILMSIFIYAGSMQFVAINLLTVAFDPINAFLITLMVNARHLFYGISMLERFKQVRSKKPYLIFGLTDENFSVICSTDAPEGIDKEWFMFFITFLNHIYWITGSAIGGILGSMASFDTKGIDFAMTALFVVIFINQWKSQNNHTAALIGVTVSIISLLLFGSSNFIIPAMAVIIVVLTLLRKQIERGQV